MGFTAEKKIKNLSGFTAFGGKKVPKPRSHETERPLIYIEEILEKMFC